MYVANCCRYRPGREDAEFGEIAGDAGCVDDVAQVKFLVAKKLTFRRFELEAGAENTYENGAKIVEMFGNATRKH